MSGSGPRTPRRFHAPPDEPEPLTDLEKAVLTLHAQGYTNAEAARHLHYSYGYIKNVMPGIEKKLGARNTTEAVVIAMRQGLISWLARRPDL